LFIALCTAGCGQFVARRIVQSPNRYPQWLAPEAPVQLLLPRGFSTNFPMQSVRVGEPNVTLCYRIVEPADFDLKFSVTNWTKRGKSKFRFTFDAKLPGATNPFTANPRGTVVLMHGYGVAQFAMEPWALQLAEDGWRCLLVDLRGHGASTGKRIYFGTRETNDLMQLLNNLENTGRVHSPVNVLGESYGAALGLRWKIVDARIHHVVAIAPYATVSNSVLNICHEYARWMPQWYLKSGLKKLPSVLHAEYDQLDPITYLEDKSISALFVAGEKDRVTPVEDVRQLFNNATEGSEWLIVPEATHEAVPYFFDELVPAVRVWFEK
jgi:pimeloyl-ACP methyl ester carboxylesterase